MEDAETMPAELSQRRRIQNRNAQRKYRRKTSSYASDGVIPQQLTEKQLDKRNLDRVYQAQGSAPTQSLIDSQRLDNWGGVHLSQEPPRNFLHDIHPSHVAAAFDNDNSNSNSILEVGGPNYAFDSGYSSSVPNLSALSSISENGGQSIQGLPMTSTSTPGFLETINNSLTTIGSTPVNKQLCTYADEPGILAAANSDPMTHNHNHNNSNASPSHRNHSDSHVNGVNSSNSASSSNNLNDTPDRPDWISMLHIASVRGHAHMISTLLEYPISIDERDSSGRTPLHLATAHGHADVVRILLARGAEINLEDSLGRTALHWTVFQKHGELLRILLQRGADVNVCDHNGWSALHVCVERGWEEGFRVLMGRGADLNLRAKKCETWRREEQDLEGTSGS
ncbi:hypothetical protein FQN51_000245 [Onygenales sp. PD_10]|nr:hypothetical protein FQN51_000245 [Onygenales sp. PD_10]